MAFRLLLVILAACSLTVLAQVDDDFAEFDDEEGEFDFDMPGELIIYNKKNFAIFLPPAMFTCNLNAEEEVVAGNEESDQFDDGDDGEEMVSKSFRCISVTQGGTN